MDLERQEITNLQTKGRSPRHGLWRPRLRLKVAKKNGVGSTHLLGTQTVLDGHTDLEQVEISFPPEALTGAMVGYPDVFPFARRLEFTHAQEPWLSDDQYCCNPKCLCQEAVLSFIRLSQRAGRTPAADPVALLPISRGQGALGRSRKEPSVFRTGLLESSRMPSRLRFAACQAAGIAQAVVWPYREKADASDRDAQKWSQPPLPLRQWQEVEKMLRSLIRRAHRCCPPGLRSDHTRKQPTRCATAGAEVGGDRDRNADR